MNVLHINQSDLVGGAAIAAYRLHQGLLEQNVDSHLLVGIVKTSSDRIQAVTRKYRIENLLFPLTSRLGFSYINIISSFDIPKHLFYQNADIINFHNLHTGYFNYLAIPNLTKNKPGVFTLHDMWSFTGHCVYSYERDYWKTGCHKCPCLDTRSGLERGNTRLEWKLKNWVYSRSNLTIVCVSKWLFELAKQSMLNRFSIHHIPYGIDLQAYQPLDSELCRSLLGIPKGKKVLMFGSESLKNHRKGGDLLVKAVSSLPKSLQAEILLLTIGSDGKEMGKAMEIPTLNLGYVSSDRLKSIAYSASDLFIFPSRADNLPLVLQESLACGTPIVSFKVGGIPDLVRPNLTGYLAEPENSQDLCNGMIELLEDREKRDRFSCNCRAIAVSEYSLELQAQAYIQLYRQLLNH